MLRLSDAEEGGNGKRKRRTRTRRNVRFTGQAGVIEDLCVVCCSCLVQLIIVSVREDRDEFTDGVFHVGTSAL